MNAPVLLVASSGRADALRSQCRTLAYAAPRRVFVGVSSAMDNAQFADFESGLRRIVDWTTEVLIVPCTPDDEGSIVGSSMAQAYDAADAMVVVTESDIPVPQFFAFADEALIRYRHDERVGFVSAASAVRGRYQGGASAFFSRFPRLGCFATWRDRWHLLDYPVQAAQVLDAVARQFTFDPHVAAAWLPWLLRVQAGMDRSLVSRVQLMACARDLLTLVPANDLAEPTRYPTPIECMRNFSWVADVEAEAMPLPFVWPEALVPDDGCDQFHVRSALNVDAAWPMPDDAPGEFARWLSEKGELTGVIDVLSSVRIAGQSTATDDFLLGCALLLCGRPDVGRALVTDAARRDPKSAAAIMARGWT